MSRLIVPAAAAALMATLLPATGAQAAKTVPAPLFGQHVSKITAGAPTSTLTRVGAIRLWDSGVTWRSVEAKNGSYTWSGLDAAVRNAEKLRASEILYTLGSTPEWAATASSLTSANSRLALYGPGSNSHPRSDDFYLDYLRDVAKRYKGRITSYQVWNEANLKDFYLGTPTQMAELTRKARVVLRSVDPNAKLVAASTTVRAKGPVGKFSKTYGKEMRKVKWPVDAVSAHFYPPATSGPDTRVSYIKKVKRYYKKYGAKRKPLWDTEMNYGDLRSYMKVQKAYTGATAATYVARTYIDSMRYGVSRVFWYGWDMHVLGTAMLDKGTGKVASGGQAFLTLQSWMVGSRWYTCKTKKGITTCTLRTPSGAKQTIRYTTKGTRTLAIPKGVSVVRRLDGSSQSVTVGQKITVTTQPILLG